MKLDIIKETEDFVAINKPSGLLSIPDRVQSAYSLKDMLKDKYGNIYTVHRIDKETSGVIVFAKNETAHKYLSEAFQGRNVVKIYTGIVLGTPENLSGEIEEPIAENPSKKGSMMVHKKGKPSLTTYEVVESFGRYSVIKFRIFTGRTHQIRVHISNEQHPIVCDPLYGDGKQVFLSSIKKKFNLGKNSLEERPLMGRLALHASTLSFSYTDGISYLLEAPLPKDFKAFINQCRINLK